MPDESGEKKSRPPSKRMKNKVELFATAYEARQAQQQVKGFCPRSFLLCGLPYKQPKESTFARHNGNFTFKIVADPEFGMPFGKDRLMPVWLATAFHIMGCPENNTIVFRSAADLVRVWDPPGSPELRKVSGREINDLRKSIQRTFGATYFGLASKPTAKGFFLGDSYRLMSRISLWTSAPGDQCVLWGNQIVLDSRFADDLRQARIPVDLHAVRALQDNPGALDLYLWMGYRSFRALKEKQQDVEIPVFGGGGLLEQLGSSIQHHRKARQSLKHHLALIKTFWRDCPNEFLFDKGEDRLVIRPAQILTAASTYLPGVRRDPPPPQSELPSGPTKLLQFDK